MGRNKRFGTTSEETKLKMRESHLGKKNSKKHNESISRAVKGKTWEERYGVETAKRIKEARRKNKHEYIK